MAHDTVRLTRHRAVTRVALDRPDVRNAFNDEMLVDLVEAFTAIRDDPEVRVAVLTGEGSCFCAGADVNWMKRVVDYTQQENYEDSLRLALMLHEMRDRGPDSAGFAVYGDEADGTKITLLSKTSERKR